MNDSVYERERADPGPRVIKENHTEDGLSETLCPEERETHYG